MELKESKKGIYLIIEIIGRLDTSNYGELENKLLAALENGEKEIVINCAGLNYVSSSGLRVFLMALKKIKAVEGHFALCSLQDNVREIFEIAGFTTIFRIYNTLDEV